MMGNFVLITLLATAPTISEVMTTEACNAAQQEAEAKNYMAMCLDVRLIRGYKLLTSVGIDKVHGRKD